MDKADEEHLKEYKEEITKLEYRVKIVKALIDGLEYDKKADKAVLDKQINEAEIDVPVEHDFPNYRRYGKK